MLEMRNVSKTFRGRPPKMVLQNVNFCLEPGKTTALMGKSGSGKSTLARILLGLEQPDSGQVLWNGTVCSHRRASQMRGFHRRVQYIAQHPESFFDPFWTLKRSVYEAGAIHGIPAQQVHNRLPLLLEQVKINPATLERYPYQVSGGEIQRISLCRALLLEPEILVLDEATSMLDVSVQAQILTLLKELKQEHGLTYLLISHEREVVDWMADRVYHMQGTGVVQEEAR